MAVYKIDDTIVNTTDETDRMPAVLEFLCTFKKVNLKSVNPFEGIVNTTPSNNETARIQPCQKLPEFRINEREDLNVKILQAGSIPKEIGKSAACHSFQVVYDALQDIRATDSSPEMSDGVLDTIPSIYNEVSKDKEVKNAKPTGWTPYKLKAVATASWRSPFDSSLILVCRADTVHRLCLYEPDFFKSSVTSNGLTIAQDRDGNKWVIVGMFPNSISGKASGIKAQSCMVNNTLYNIMTEFAFHPECMVLTTFPDKPRLCIDISKDWDNREICFKSTMYTDIAEVTNPKGIIRVLNAAPQNLFS